MSEVEVKGLVTSILKFLVQQTSDSNLSPDSKESVEVAIQCLETAYGVSSQDPCSQEVPSLVDIFTAGTSKAIESQVSEEDKVKADTFKNEGNNLIKAGKYREAVEAYSHAIQLDRHNAVYFCNRAAASNRLGDYNSAVEDCKIAIAIDPQYCKAHGRMGFAYSSLNRLEDAIRCYRKAADIDPENEGYRNNIRMAEEKIQQRHAEVNSFTLPGPGAAEVTSLLRNPALVSMATHLMQDPHMQYLMSGFMSSSVSQTPQAQNTGLEALLQAGQQLAAQMQQSNPQLVAALRQHLNSQGPPPNREDSQDRPTQ